MALKYGKDIFIVHMENQVIKIAKKVQPMYLTILTKIMIECPNEPFEIQKAIALIKMGQGFQDMTKEEVDTLLGKD